jgi:hypothetical protein
MTHDSPIAAARLYEVVEETGSLFDAEELMGETDCPEGCKVEPDGHCSHGYESAALTAELI